MKEVKEGPPEPIAPGLGRELGSNGRPLPRAEGLTPMEPAGPNKRSALILTLAVAVAGVAVGALLVTAWPKLTATKSAPVSKKKYDPTPELLIAINDSQLREEEVQGELNALRLQVGELYERMVAKDEGLPSGMDRNLRSTLPPPYVQQVDSFFKSPGARNLLSAKVATSNALRFDKPIFVSHDVITVPYSFGGKYQYLMVKVIILDYYDLQFDVLWDSLEGG